MSVPIVLGGLPWCPVVTIEPADAPPGRYFLAYRARHGFRWLLGQGVVDEFATVSSPIFFAPRGLLGRVYDAGITLGHRRDAEMAIDTGWPPLVVGLDRLAPPLNETWQQELLDAIGVPARKTTDESAVSLRTRGLDDGELVVIRFGSRSPRSEVTLIATDAPLLPAQLARLCDVDAGALTLAVSTGNRLLRQRDGAAQTITACSEARLARLAAGLACMIREGSGAGSEHC